MCVCLGEEAAADGPGGGAVAQGVPVRAPEFSAHSAVPRRARRGLMSSVRRRWSAWRSPSSTRIVAGARMGRACSRRRGNALRWAVRWPVGAGVSWASVRSARPALMSSGRTCVEAVAGSQGVGQQRGLCASAVRVHRPAWSGCPDSRARAPSWRSRRGRKAARAAVATMRSGGEGEGEGGGVVGAAVVAVLVVGQGDLGSGRLRGPGGQGALVPVPPLVPPVLGHEYRGQRRPGSALRTPR